MSVKGKILIDAHIHSSGISYCSRISPETLVEICHEDGLDGIILTNHYKSNQIEMDFNEWRKKYVEEYFKVKNYGEKYNFRVFFGLEITLDYMNENDFTVYGISIEDFLTSPRLCSLSLPELSEYVHSKGALIYHAHPFRNTVPCDGTLVDGTEINCHPLYKTNAESGVREFAKKYNLRISCGSDYHGDTYKAHCGMWIPEDIDNEQKLLNYLKNDYHPLLTIAPDPTTDKVGIGKGKLPQSWEQINPKIEELARQG